jgi:hypothetical protein
MEEHSNGASVSTPVLDKRDHNDGASPKEKTNTRGSVEDVKKREYLSGVRLWLVVASVTIVAFVMLLDMSIIVTASLWSSLPIPLYLLTFYD